MKVAHRWGVLMRIPQCMILEFPDTLKSITAHKTVTEYFWKFQ